MLAIVDYLNNNTLESITEKYAINYRSHQDFPNLYSFKYNMIDSPMNEEVVKDARGIILDANDNWSPISMAYRKFFNYREGNADMIDWNSARILEKLDGSLMTMYYYDGAWRVSTSGTPDAKVNVGDFDFTFEQLFFKTYVELGYEVPTNTNLCYSFELMTKYNRIVVQHDKPRLVLHGIRDMLTLDELNFEKVQLIGALINCEVVSSYPLCSLNAVVESCLTLNPMKQEGYVVVDKHFNRIKVKSPQYVALHHMVDRFSRKYMMQIILTNECDEFLNYFPEHKELYYETKDKYDNLIELLETVYEEHKYLSSKYFGLATKNIPLQGALFMVKNGKADSIRDYFQKQIKLKGIKVVAKHLLQNI